MQTSFHNIEENNQHGLGWVTGTRPLRLLRRQLETTLGKNTRQQEGILNLPISTWQYKSGTNAERDPDYQDGHGVRRGGEGGQVRHVGPMAQDLWEAFEVGSNPRRFDTIDSDGITLAPVQGTAHKQRQVSSASDALRGRIKELKAALQAQERQLAVQAEELHSQSRRIGLLQGRLAGPPSPVTPSSLGLFAKAF